jgi:hypothetical protein
MVRVRIVQLSRLIDLLGEECEVKLDKRLTLREFLSKLAGDREEVREELFLGDRLSPDIFIMKGDVCISLQKGIDKAIIEDGDVLSMHQVAAGG